MKSMLQFFLLKLVYQQLRLSPGRAMVTLAGIVASACAVVWVVSGYDALVSQFDENAGKYLGRYDMLLVPQGPPGSAQTIDEGVVRQLRADAGILELNPVHQSRVTVTRFGPAADAAPEEETALGLLLDGRPPVNGAPPIEPVLVGTPAAEPPYELISGEWLSQDSAVLSSGAAESLRVSVGEQVLVTSMANQLRLQVVGIVQQAPDTPSLASGRGRGGAGGRGGSSGRGGTGGPSGPGPQRSRSASDLQPATDETLRPGADSQAGSASKSAGSKPGQPESTAHGSSLGIPTAFVQGVATTAVYVRPEVAERITGLPAAPTVLQVALRDTLEVEQFRDKWQASLSASRPPLQIVDFSDVRAGLTNSRSLSAHRSQAYAATGFASLAAVFIIFSLLSMGVNERAREFALLRAVAFSRAQIAALVALESLALAVVGWLGGLLTGFLLVLIGSLWMPSLFTSGAALGWTCVWLTGATVLLGAVGAAILPAWKATRIQPLEALAASPVERPQWSTYSAMAWIGLSLVIVAPLSVFVLPLPEDWRVWCYSMVTYPALLIGMALLTPTIVVCAERVFAAALARLFGLDQRLLRTQLTNNLWRTIGATLALSIGLGLFASTQIWGYSMLQPFLPGKWLPDMLVAFQPYGLNAAAEEEVGHVDGVKASEVMPLAIEQAQFDWGDQEAPAGMGYDNTVLFGIDAERCLTGDQPFLKLRFVEGQPASAAEALASGNTCLISQDFSRTSGKRVGDTITLIPPAEEEERVNYRVAGIVDLPGWQWITKFSGVRRHFVRTSSMMFVSRDSVLHDFHLPRPEFCWLNLEGGANIPQIEADMQRIAEAHSESTTFKADGLGQVTSYRPFARVTATGTVTRAISLHADQTIWGMSQLPLVTLCIMSLAVVNAVIASVRARQWEFGVLRSVGTTRLQLVRLVLAETLLIGISACALSLLFGLIAGWCGVGMASYGRWGAFVGEPAFLVPWWQLLFGFGLTLLLCAAAAIWPALRIGRAEPLALLAAGRGAR